MGDVSMAVKKKPWVDMGYGLKMAIEIVDFPMKNCDLSGFGPENVGLIFPMK